LAVAAAVLQIMGLAVQEGSELEQDFLFPLAPLTPLL